MIKQLHPKNTTSTSSRNYKLKQEMPVKQLIQQISKELMQPREEAIKAIMAKAAELKLV